LVTSTMSAIHFTMIDCSRTALVWTIDLFLMYKAPENLHQFGEKWTDYSPLQAAGFLILIFGQCIYGGVLTFPIATKFLYPDLSVESISSIKYSRVASRHMATPLPPYSPEAHTGKAIQGGKGIFGNSKEVQPLETVFTSMGKDNALMFEAKERCPHVAGA